MEENNCFLQKLLTILCATRCNCYNL